MRKTYGPLKAKKCKKGKPCGGTCISKNNICRLMLSSKASKLLSEVSNSLTPFGKVYDEEEFLPTFSKKLGVSEEEAEKIAYAVKKWSISKYHKIRVYDRSDNPEKELNRIEPEIPEYVRSIRTLLSKGPKYQGELYRGLDFFDNREKSDFLTKLKSEEGLKIDAMSSFSASRDIAESFTSTVGNGVLLRVRNSSSGVAISELVSNPTEEEVIIPKNTSYRLSSISELRAGLTLVELEELL